MPNSAPRSSFLANLQTQSKMALAFGSLLLLLLAGNVTFLVTQKEAATARAAVTHTRLVRDELNRMVVAILDQESSVRGYVLSTTSDFLATYREGQKIYAESLESLRELVSDNPTQQLRLDQIDTAMVEWSNAVNAPVMALAEMPETHERAMLMVSRGDGKVQSERMRVILAAMDDTERKLQKEREARRDYYNHAALMINYGLIAGGLLLGLLAMLSTQRLIARPLRDITDLMTRLANRDHSVEVPDRTRKDEIGDLSRALQIFKDMSIETHDNSWVKTQVSTLSAELQKAGSHTAFGENLLSQLAPLLSAPLAVFYQQREDGELHLLASYGLRERRGFHRSYRIGDGLVGQCAKERRQLVVTDLPPDYVRVHSSLGEAPPRCVVLLPLLLRDQVLGVLEFGALNSFGKLQMRLLEELMPLLALSLDNLSRALKTQNLLEETQAQAEELAASEESLKAQQEELRVTNEQLEQQSKRLRVSEEELRVQAEELKVSNEELQLKSDTLNQQKEQLEQLQRETQQKAEELAQASRYKSEFLANMSHELRTPLNSMLILSKSLADNDEGNLDKDQQEAAKIINESGHNLLRLINDILDLSKVEAGKMELLIETVQLREFAQGIDRNFRHVARERKLEFAIEIDPALPATMQQDAGKIGQVVTNLLSNAFKFTASGRVTFAIGRPAAGEVLPGVDPAQTLALRVTDTGIGIPADKLQSVFEAFEQVDGTTSRKYGGTGLGLSISRSMAQLLGGTITLSSVEGQGTTFTLLLPQTLQGGGTATAMHAMSTRRAPPPVAPSGSTAHVPAAPIQPPVLDRSKPLILVIEDDPHFAKILADSTRKRGCEAITAADGESGYAAAEEYQPTGIILDVALPGMDGWSVMDKLKSNPKTRHIPVHFMSAEDESLRGLGMGAVGYLVKPVSKEGINAAFDKVLHFAEGTPRKLLLVDDDRGSRVAVRTLLDLPSVEIVEAPDGADGLSALQRETYDCIILDMMLPDMDGLEFLRRATLAGPLPPVVIYSAKTLTPDETLKLRQYTDSIVIKSARSPERLIDEVTLFLHSIRDAHAPAARIERAAASDVAGKTTLIVDDDMRNVFALSRALRSRGLNVVMAEDGYKAIAQLEQNKLIDIVLMDIMMPGMDGYATMREIRKRAEWKQLPIIAVSAKAMRGDREKCIEAGANDYLAKPIDIDKLVSMMRVLL